MILAQSRGRSMYTHSVYVKYIKTRDPTAQMDSTLCPDGLTSLWSQLPLATAQTGNIHRPIRAFKISDVATACSCCGSTEAV